MISPFAGASSGKSRFLAINVFPIGYRLQSNMTTSCSRLKGIVKI